MASCSVLIEKKIKESFYYELEHNFSTLKIPFNILCIASLLVKGKFASLMVFIFKSVICSSFTEVRILTANA